MINIYNYASLLLMVLVITQVGAQGIEDTIGFEDTINDTNAAPINFLIPLAIAIGAVLGIKKLK